ncbi:MAG: two-component sensor histidine kinase [Cellvibrionaceae bacterium]|nr:two-component sensor histidine kinase [Cellvibrionaceae bacterium]
MTDHPRTTAPPLPLLNSLLSALPSYLSKKSLVGRFVLASLLILPLFISLSGTLLVNSFKHSQTKAEQEKLQAQLYLLLSLAEIDKTQITLPKALTEPRFNQQNSGLYGFVYNDKGQELWRSASSALLTQSFYNQQQLFQADNTHFQPLTLDHTKTVNLFSYDVEWVDPHEKILALRFIIASNNAPLAAELRSYQQRTWQWLAAMTLLLLAAQMIIMRWGLKPLQHLSRQLKALQANTIQQLDDDYPEEIRPIVNNFNNIMNHEKRQRERYRNTMSDLAHSLKTPLAVIQSYNNQQTNNNKPLQEQIQRINQIIDHQLKRAVIQANKSSIQQQNTAVSIKIMAGRLINILDKVYADKHLSFHNLIDDTLLFYGDESDLLEILGNLLDNACKYGKSAVTLTGTQQAGYIKIRISDNGNGIAQADTLLARGARGDTAQSGQGIGLAISLDIISSYQGELTADNQQPPPQQPGACFCVSLPVQ